MNALHNPDGAIDERHPWLGLASFSEQTRGFFYGRDGEVAELARRIQRKLLTVLFGQSGLGKTSILQAGIVPRLREQGYCPVYVRVDYSPGAPAASDQIKLAIVQATMQSANWTGSGAADEGESLWEFLHQRDVALVDAGGKPLIPLLIFDQFEEMFTLAQADDDGRSRAAAFIDALSELVENRPSAALEARLDDDDSAAERFDFSRSDYRVLISLREDYLPHLEGLKDRMPSITQNRLRLAPMSGQQALAAVSGPGAALVSDDVAEAIVRFVAGGSEVAHAQVEPSLLSLICRELNDTRIAAGRDAITLDLLAGSHASILSDFYERALADQPAAVRAVIEDLLLTESGYRENVAAERVVAAFATAGAAPDALAALVDRRLLRIEERLDVRRVELTHDVLCGVVRASRERRTAREALEANDRLVEAQRVRERATRRSLVRARIVAATCASLMVMTAGASVYAYRISQRAEQARNQSERLMAYLSDDFARELDGAGNLEVVAAFSKRTVDYYAGLPQNTPGSETERNRAVAMVGYGETLASLDKARAAQAETILAEALAILETRVTSGDTSEATLVALGRGLTARGRALSSKGNAEQAIELCQRAAKYLLPLATGPTASVAARRAYGNTLSYLGTLQMTRSDYADSNRSESAAKAAFASIGARELRDLPAAIGYAYGAAWQTTSQLRLGHREEAERTGDEAYALISKVLELRPGHLRALRTRGYVSEGRGNVASEAMRLGDASNRFAECIEAWLESTHRDRMNTSAWLNLGDGHRQLAEIWFRLGRPQEAMRSLNAALKAFRGATTAGSKFFQLTALSRLAEIQADLGDQAGSLASLAAATRAGDERIHGEPAGSAPRVAVGALYSVGAATTAALNSDVSQAATILRAAIAQLAASKTADANQVVHQNLWLYRQNASLGTVEYRQGDYAAAVKTLQSALAFRARNPPGDRLDQREQADTVIMLSMALSQLNRGAEADAVLAPALALHRALAKSNTDEQLQHVEFASALVAQALAVPASKAASLREARALVTALPVEMRALRSVALWRDRIELAQSSDGAARIGPIKN